MYNTMIGGKKCMGEFSRFKGDCWTVNYNWECSASITSQTDSDFRIDGVFRTTSDMAGAYWFSKDKIKHELLAYPDDTDYTGVKLRFDFSTMNCNLIGSSLSLKHEDGNNYFVDPRSLSSSHTTVTESISSNNGRYRLGHYNALDTGLTVKDGSNNTMVGYANMNTNCIIDSSQNVAVFMKPTENVSLSFGSYDPSDATLKKEIGFNAYWDHIVLDDDDIIESSLYVLDNDGNLLERGTWDEGGYRDYVYYPWEHSVQPQNENAAAGMKVYYCTPDDTSIITENVPDGVYRYEIQHEFSSENFTGNNIGRYLILQDKDYYFDIGRSELRLISSDLLTSGSVTYNYSTQMTIDFNNMVSMSYKTSDDVLVNEQNIVDPCGIIQCMFALVPVEYTENEYKIIDNREFNLVVSNIQVTNGFLGYEPDAQISHNYRHAEGYDDVYDLAPRRLAYMMSRLGYHEWLDFYIGASHFYEKRGTVGEIARSGDMSDVDLSKLTLTPNTIFNKAYEVWMEDYFYWSKYYGMNNIVVSVSLENLQIPDSWKQKLWDGTPGRTGWTPATSFYSITNTEVRSYIRDVCEAHLDVLVDLDLPPILQFGEPWWWWQEFYPESVSNDPDNQVSNVVPYPGNPPAFYDDATKEKYRREHNNEELPVYKTAWEEFDEDVIGWLREQLEDYSNFLRGIVKAYEHGVYTTLYFPPYITDVDRVPEMMQKVNYPVDAWNNGQLDFIQLEDYDWVITDDPKHDLIWDFAQKLNIPNQKVHYFSGFCNYPNDAPREWPLILSAAQDAFNHDMAEVYLWSGTQIRRDNIIINQSPVEVESSVVKKSSSSVASPLLNIIVLDAQEQPIRWLLTDLADVKEINEAQKVKKITLTYPLEKSIKEYESQWFSQGNKIFIPHVFGLKNCLYVINNTYSLDYWEENTVTIEAEEVLTELNYQVVGVYEDNIKINKEQLTTWFGALYDIGTIDTLESNKNKISAQGTVTLMNLLRTIEENTERVFITEYTYENNIIQRKLHLLDEDSLLSMAKTEFLDLNYNLESLELEVDEDKTYSAVAPLLSINNTQTTQSATSESDVNAYIEVSTDVTETVDSKEVYQNWLDFEVEYREYIPMIRQKESDGTMTTKAYWYAPFQKRKGDLYIEHIGYSDSSYKSIIPPKKENGVRGELLKLGTVSTSETDVYAIYNVLANNLMDKLNTTYKLSLKVKDISDYVGMENLGYEVYETLYIKIPGFDYYVPATVTKTTKNPHLPGDDSITVETSVLGTHLMKDTVIESEGKIIPADSTESIISGLLMDEDGEPIPDELVSINVRLVEAYGEMKDNTVNITPLLKEFKPSEETYIFSSTEIWELEKNLRYDNIQVDLQDYYYMTDVTGNSYKIPLEWCLSIYYTLIQAYINEDYPIGSAKFKQSIEVHYYDDVIKYLPFKTGYLKDILPELAKTGNEKYFPSAYYYIILYFRYYYQSLGIDNYDEWCLICSNEVQNGPTCIANSISNACAFSFNYKSEKQVVTLLGRDYGYAVNEFPTKVLPVVRKLGFETNIVDFTVENVKKYINNRDSALLSVWANRVGYDSDGAHEILLNSWREVNGTLYCMYFDSNYPIFDPTVMQGYDPAIKNVMTFSDLRDAICMVDDGNGGIRSESKTNARKSMITIQQTADQLPLNYQSRRIPKTS